MLCHVCKWKNNGIVVLVLFLYFFITEVIILGSGKSANELIGNIFTSIKLGTIDGLVITDTLIRFAIYMLFSVLIFTILCLYLLNNKFSGVKKNEYFKVFATLLLLSATIVLVLQIIREIIEFASFEISPYAGTVLSTAIRFFITAVYAIGSYYAIENTFKIKSTFIVVKKFIFSKVSALIFLILIAVNLVYQLFNYTFMNYFYSKLTDPFADGASLSGFLNTISEFKLPIWFLCIQWTINALIITFVLVAVRKVYSSKFKADIADIKEIGFCDDSSS